MPDGDQLLDDAGNEYLDDAGNEVLSDGTTACPTCPPCDPATDKCWYQVDPCVSGDSNWIGYGSADPVTGECPPMAEDHTWAVAPGECYTVLAGAAGTTTTPATQLPAPWEVFSCDDCVGLTNCFDCDADCNVLGVIVTVAGYVTKPEWCPSSAATPGGFGDPRELMHTDDLVNGVWTALPTSTPCVFRFRRKCTAADPVATFMRFDNIDDPAGTETYSEDATDCFVDGSVTTGGSMSQLAATWNYPVALADDKTDTSVLHYPVTDLPPGTLCDAGGKNFNNAGTGSPCPASAAYNECDDWQGTSPGLFGRPTCGGTIKLVAILKCPEGLRHLELAASNITPSVMPDPKVWGPLRWAELHKFALTATPDALAAFVKGFRSRVPCGTCRGHLSAFVRENPPEKAVDPFAWSVELHNAVNAKLGTPAVSLDQARATWGASSAG